MGCAVGREGGREGGVCSRQGGRVGCLVDEEEGRVGWTVDPHTSFEVQCFTRSSNDNV